ncbi:MAG: hypothetical protein M9965_07500 [Anaerolineae bacterium]|nr:hypothetical protein [Anaerolineae bacterium]
MNNEALTQKLIEHAKQDDTFNVLALASQHPDSAEAIGALNAAIRHFYWQEPNLAMIVKLSWAGIQWALHLGATEYNSETAYAVLSGAKGLAYNLASFVWPGWGKPDLGVDATALALGREAAQVNLQLAHVLEKGPVPLSRALWLVAAYELNNGNYSAAAQRFGDAAQAAESADSESDLLLNRAYVCLANLLADQSVESQTAYDEALDKLNAVEHGAEFVEQVATARRIFS